MMEFVKLVATKYCDIVDEDVDILLYEDKRKKEIPYCTCSRCGKGIKNKMYVVQSKDTGLEHFYLGSECIKKI